MLDDRIPRADKQTIPQVLNLFKSLIFPALIIIGFFVANAVAVRLDNLSVHSSVPQLWMIIKWAIVGFIAIINITFLAGMGVLAHDGVHRVLFKNNVINDLVSSLLSTHALIPFFANKQFHLNHHQYAHQQGKDPEEVIHYRTFWSALLIGPFFALAAQYQIMFQNLIRPATVKKRIHSVLDICFLGIALVNYLYWLPKLGFELKYTYFPLLAVLPLGYNFRAMSDHYGLVAVKRKSQYDVDINREDNDTLQAQNSGWVVLTNPILQWIWSNVNYHEVHHKFPYLSYRYLPEVYEETKNEFPYKVVKGYMRSLLALRRKQYYEVNS